MSDDADRFDREYIDAKREGLREALAAEGISKEDLIEIDPDDVLDAVGRAVAKHQSPVEPPEED